MISATSRYLSATVDVVTDDRGTHQRMEVQPPFAAVVIQYTYYQVVEGDRIDTIAHEHFGDGRLWWKIADANPEVLDWVTINPGMIIRLPNG